MMEKWVILPLIRLQWGIFEEEWVSGGRAHFYDEKGNVCCT